MTIMRECSDRQAGGVAKSLHTHTDPQVGGRESARLSLDWAFETLQPTPRDRLPVTRPHFLIIPRQFQLFTHMSLRGSILIQCGYPV